MPLSPKQRRFAAEYPKDLNATQAAIRAGYSVRGAPTQGHRLLKNAEIRSAIAEKIGKAGAEDDALTADILKELKRIGFSDIGNLIGSDGTPKAIADLDEGARRALASVEVQVIGGGVRELDDGPSEVKPIAKVVRVKQWDKLKALELLGKYRKLFTDKVEHSGGLTLEQIVTQSMETDK